MIPNLTTPTEFAGVLPIRSATMLLYPSEAKTMVETKRWKKQRPIRDRIVRRYRHAILRGEMRSLSLVMARYPNGELVLMDGQHRLAAFAEVGTGPIPAVVITHDVKDDEEAAALFATIDVPMKRNRMDSIQAFGVADDTNLTKDELRYLGQAIPLLESRFIQKNRANTESIQQEVDAARRWLPFMEAFVRHTAGSTNEVRSMLRRAPVTAVALVTAKYQPEKAYEFWRGVALEDGLRRGDSRRALLNWLRRNGRMNSEVPAELYARYVAVCWNAFYEGREIEHVKVVNKDKNAGVVISGTPYKGGE